jgi:1-acyl-sn-glycerol-3-phosphate acyltransferase
VHQQILPIFTKKALLLYQLLKIWGRLAMLIFCRKVVINKPTLLHTKGPLLLAANHPNSFLDGILLDILFKQPVWSLARGDAFKTKWITRFFTAIKLLPVFRTSEGVENLSGNYQTFNSCIHIFKKNGVVLIFSEGKCINEWHLRPLKKGTARLAMQAWEQHIPLTILPVGINYSSFSRFGKNVFINFGESITPAHINMLDTDGARHQSFNNHLQQQLKELVFEIDPGDREKQKRLLEIQPSVLKKIVLFIPAVLGLLLNAPLYIPLELLINKKTFQTDHYDSVITGVLFLIYPVYLLLLLVIAAQWFPLKHSLLLLLIIPFTAWSYTQLKPQLDK